MKHVILVLFLCFTLFCCQKKETVLETEKIAFHSVFNSVVDSVYLKSTGNKNIENKIKKKTIVVYDSLQTESPNSGELSRNFKNIKNSYFDTISRRVYCKINLSMLEKSANFKYKNSLSFGKDPFPASFWTSKYALPGFLVFSKLGFDEDRKFGAFYCTYTNGNYFNAKYFLIYIKKEYGKWKLDKVTVQNRTY